jgi:hypothetical protein
LVQNQIFWNRKVYIALNKNDSIFCFNNKRFIPCEAI